MKGEIILILFSTVVIVTDAIIVHDNEFEYTSGERHYYGNQGQQPKVPPTDDSPRAGGLNFHEVDAFGDDFVDFGAQTGPYGAFTWHANYPVEDQS